jgi:hypothetical protein
MSQPVIKISQKLSDGAIRFVSEFGSGKASNFSSKTEVLDPPCQ